MSIVDLEIGFHGKSTDAGVIDARLFAESLTGYSAVFARANEISNGEMSTASVLVRADFRSGSFIANIQLVQTLAEATTRFITSHPFADAGGLASVIGFIARDTAKESLIGLYKWLRGERPEKVIQVGGDVEITYGQNKKMVSNVVYHLYGDSAIRLGLTQLTGPVRTAGVDRISVKEDGIERMSIERAEAAYFVPEVSMLNMEEQAMYGERETVLVVSKLSFTEKSTWTFFERGATVTARIEDEEFWRSVHEHNVTFGEGDRIRVKIAWSIEKRNKLVQKNTIKKVYEVLPHLKQYRLDRREDQVD